MRAARLALIGCVWTAISLSPVLAQTTRTVPAPPGTRAEAAAALSILELVLALGLQLHPPTPASAHDSRRRREPAQDAAPPARAVAPADVTVALGD